jgi:predicted nucleic acid-binding Zn ribbon protein
MPVFEYLCEPCHAWDESYLQHWYDPNPPCSECGGPTVRTPSRFGTPLSGSLHKYMDPNKEGAHRDGVWMYAKNTIGGQPEPVYIETMEQMKKFCKAEGLAAPMEVPTNATVSSDGKRMLSDGMPGSWNSGMPSVPSGVWDMTKSMTSLKGRTPTPIASGPPCTVTAVDASQMESIAAEAARG